MINIYRKILVLGFLAFCCNQIYAQNCTVNAGVATTICPGSPFVLTGSSAGLFASGGTAVWSQVSGPAVSVSATTIAGSSATATVSGYSPGNNYTFRLTGTCTDGNQVHQDVIYTTSTATVASAGPSSNVCPGTYTLQGNALQTGETGTWTVVSGTLPLPNNANSPTSTVNIPTGNVNSSTGIGSTTYRWTIVSGACTSHSDVVITNAGGQSPVTAGSNQTVTCYTTTGSIQLNGSYGGNNTLGQQGTWSLVSGPNTPSFNNIHIGNATVSNLIQGTYDLRWTVAGPCVNGSADVILTVTTASQNVTTASNANLTYCDGRTSTVIAANAAQYTNETLNWVQTGGPAGATFSDASSATTTIGNLDGHSSYQFQYTITNSVTNCSSTGTYNIAYTVPPAITVNSGNSSMVLACNANTASIPYTVSGGNLTQWSLISGPAAAVLGGGTGSTSYTNASNSTQTITGLTVIGAYVIRFKRSSNNSSGGCNAAFQDVTLYVSQPVTAANAGTKQVLACNVYTTNLQGNTPAVGSGSWTQVSGPNTATMAGATIPNTGISGLVAGTYVFRWLISGGQGNCGNSQSDVQVVVSSPAPTTSAAGSNVAACYATPINLQGNQPAGNETGTWTVSPSTGIVFSDIHNPKAVVTGMSNNTAYTFTWQISNSCGSSSSNVVITTSATAGPQQANAGPDQCLANGTHNFTLGANMPGSGETGVWTLLAGAPNSPAFSNAYNTTVTGALNGTYTFQWSLAKGGCSMTYDTVQVTVSSPVTASNAGSNFNQCGFSPITLAGNTPVTGTGQWTQTGGPGGAVIANAALPNTTVSGLQVGQYTFQWKISNGACASSSSTVTVNVSTPPTTANAGSDISLCGAATSTTLSANTITTGSGLWSVVSGPSNPTFSNPSSPTSMVSGLVTGTYDLRWTSTYGPYCAPSTSDVHIYVTQAAAAGANQNLCAQTSTLLSGNDGSSGSWTQVGTSPAIATLTANSSYSTIASNMTTGGAYTFMYSLPAVGSCPATSSTLTVNVVPAASQAQAGDDVNACAPTAASNVTVTLGANSTAPTSGTGTWSVQSKFPVSLPTPTFSNIHSLTSSLSGLQSGATNTGVYILNWNVSTGAPCATGSNDVVRVTVYTAPSPSVAGPDQTSACSASIVMAATAPAVGIGTWTQTGGPALAAGSIDQPNSPTTAILNTTPGNTYTFTWTVANGPTCSANTSTVNIQVVAGTPGAAVAGPAQSLCNQYSTTLGATAVQSGETGTWTVTSKPAGAPIPSFSNVNDPSATLSNLQQGTYSLLWTVSNAGTCTTSAPLSITVSDLPTPSNAGPDATYCLYSPVTLAATPITSGTGTWSVVSKPVGSPGVTFSSVNAANASVFGLAQGAYVFQWTSSNGVCSSSTSTVNITIGTCQIGAVKTLASSPVQQPDGSYNVTFSFGLTNTGTAPLSGIQLTDNLSSIFPATSFTVTSLTAGGSLTANSSFDGNGNAGLLTPASSSLAAGASGTLSLVLNMKPGTFNTFNNTVTASAAAPGGVTVSDVSNNGPVLNQPSGTVTPVNFPLIGLGKIATAPVLLASGSYTMTYTLNVKNYGQQALSSVQVNDLLSSIFPGPITWSLNGSITAAGGLVADNTYTGLAGHSGLLKNTSTLASGATGTITIPLKINLSGNFGTYTNTATASALTPDAVSVTDVSNNSASPDGNGNGTPFDDSTPTPLTFQAPDVQILKSISNSSPTAGTNVTFTLTASNNGPGDASGVTVSDLLPAGYTYVSSTPDPGTTYTSSTGLWTIGLVPNGSSKQLLIVATVKHAQTAASYQNTATSNAPYDSNPANNTSAVSPVPVQTPPQPVNDSHGGYTPGATAVLNISGNDLLSDGLTAASSSNSSLDIDVVTTGVQTSLVVSGQGTWTYNPGNGNISFQPIAGYTISPSPIQYTLSENATGLTANATVTLTYVNAPPVAVNDAKGGLSPGAVASINILANDKLSDGTAATPALTDVDLDPGTPGVDHSLTAAGQGVWNYDGTTGIATFTPNAGYTISPTPITYKLIENITGLSATATITPTYVNAPPVALNDAKGGLAPGAVASINILANDRLSDGTAATPALTDVDLDPGTPGVDHSFTAAGQGVWNYDGTTGIATFTPNAGYTISPTPITYKLLENITGLSATATITPTYVNAPPVAANDAKGGLAPGAVASINILANDKLSDGTTATPALTDVDLDPGTLTVDHSLTVAGQGVWNYDGTTGIATFTPNAGYTISATPITYKLIENITGLSATATITPTYVQAPPVAMNDTQSGLAPGAVASINILANDKLSDGTAATPALTDVDLNPGTPAVDHSLTAAGQGVWNYDGTTGIVTFTPNAGYTISPTPITYKLIENITGLSATATITPTYVPAPPVAVNDAQSGLAPGVVASINILSNDKLSDGTAATPALTDVDLDPGTPTVDHSLTVAAQGVWNYDGTTGIVTFTPNAGYTVSPTPITYKLIENITGLSATASITPTYVPAPPVAVNDAQSGLAPGAVASLNILANDKLSDGSAATTALTDVDLNPGTPTVDHSLTVAAQGVWNYDGTTGIVTFTPNAGYTVSPTPITYKLIENITGLSAKATITPTYVPAPPVAVNDAKGGLAPGAVASLNILANDKLSDGSAATTALTDVDLNPGTPGVDHSLTATGQGVWNYNGTTGTATFTPNAGYTVSPTAITYKLIENITGLSATATITPAYVPAPPVPANDALAGILPGSTASFNIQSNDRLSDGSPATTALSTIDIDPATTGIQTSLVVAGQGTYSYDPSSGLLGFVPVPGFTTSPAPIPYALTELLTGLSANATVTITYQAIPPVPFADALSGLLPGATATLNILANDKLSDGSQATTALTSIDLDPNTAGIQNTLTVASQGIWSYDQTTGNASFTPQPGFTISPTTLPYSLIENSTGLSAQTTITLRYSPQPPVPANDILMALQPGATGTLNILANDKLSDGSPATAALTAVDLDASKTGVQSTLVVNGQGIWTYDAASGNLSFAPQPGYTISPSPITYGLIENYTGLSANATVKMVYGETAPIATDDLSKGNKPAHPAVLDILANDKQSDGSPAMTSLTTVDLDPVAPGVQNTLTVKGQGVWTYDTSTGKLTFTPQAGFTTSPGSIGYVLVENETGLTATAKVTVSYDPLPPTAVNDTGSGGKPGAPTVVDILANDKLSDGTPVNPAEVTVDLDQNQAGVQTSLSVANEGTWVYDPSSGNVSFTPQPGYIADPDPITYTLTEVLTGLSSNATITLKSAVTLQVGLAKTVTEPKLELNGSYTFTYTFTVKNYGNVPLTSLAVDDDLRATFPNPMDVVVKSLSASGPLMTDPAFDGLVHKNLLLPASTLTLAESETVTLVVNVLPNGRVGTFTNSATASGTSPVGGSTSDVSMNGSNPDPNGNNIPSDPGEDQPTPVTFIMNDVIIPEGFSPNGDGVNDRFIIENAQNAKIDLTIFNRWGNVVYKNADYKNDWDGTCNTGLHFGQNVPDGTYYYIAIVNGTTKKVRFITIRR